MAEDTALAYSIKPLDANMVANIDIFDLLALGNQIPVPSWPPTSGIFLLNGRSPKSA
jgi:hypothetical protein